MKFRIAACRCFSFTRIALLAILMMASLGCARSPDDSYSSVSLTGDLAFPIQVLTDNFVRRQKPAVYVQPTASLGHKPSGIFVPLRMVQQITNAVTFSDMLSRQIYQVWLSLDIFRALEYDPAAGPFDKERALAFARRKNAEVLVGGYINHFMDGGANGSSSITLAIDVYDVRTGNQIWSIAQSGLMEKEKKHDFYLFNITERNPADPSGLIARSLAWDMGQLMRKWINPYADAKSSVWDTITDNKAF